MKEELITLNTEHLYRKLFNTQKEFPKDEVHPESQRHQELLDAAQSLLERLASPQEHLYFRRSHAGETMPDFDPHVYFEARGMTADEQTMCLLNELLELYANVLKHIGDFNLRQRYLSAPYLKMDASLLAASARIAELDGMFTENHESLLRFMVANNMKDNIMPLHIKEEKSV